jgi:CubicO group peptidase (beta-lactamase class C family)
VPVSRIERRATSYFPRFAADNHYGQDLMRPLEYSCYSGASVFLSTPSDLVRFAQGVNSGALLKPETVRLFQTAQKLPSGEPTGYGLGWDLETADVAGRKEAWIGHEGMVLGGMAGSLIIFPERGVVIALLSNTSYADTESLGLKIAEAFLKAK